MKKPMYELSSKVWLYPGMSGWHFVSVNKKVSREIKELFGQSGRGFGSIPVKVTTGTTAWDTSIFPDKKTATYILPLKVAVRKKENITAGKQLSFSIEIKT